MRRAMICCASVAALLLVAPSVLAKPPAPGTRDWLQARSHHSNAIVLNICLGQAILNNRELKVRPKMMFVPEEGMDRRVTLVFDSSLAEMPTSEVANLEEVLGRCAFAAGARTKTAEDKAKMIRSVFRILESEGMMGDGEDKRVEYVIDHQARRLVPRTP